MKRFLIIFAIIAFLPLSACSVLQRRGVVVPMLDNTNLKWGYIDTRNQWVIPAQFERAHPYTEGLAGVKVSGKWGFIDETGKVVIEPQYEVAYLFSEGLAAVRTEKKWGFIDKTGAFVIPPRYEHASNFADGRGMVQENDMQIYLDKSGNPAFPARFEEARPFSDGLAAVREFEAGVFLWGYIDTKGKMVIQPQYDEAGDFVQGRAEVVLQGATLTIDKTGKPGDPVQ